MIYNTKAGKIIGFVVEDTSRSEATLEPDVVSRWISPDPMAYMAPGWTPYRFGYNNPIFWTDPNGLLESKHTDEDGNMVAEYDDGDDGVYVHSNGTTREQIDQQRMDNRNTGGEGFHIGDIGGVINADDIYSNALRKNADEAEGIYSPFTFKNHVQNKGKWDLKNNRNTIYGVANDGVTKFSFRGELMDSQDLGNHHFGVVGKAYGLFSENFMLRQAGAAQMAAGTSKAEWQKFAIRMDFQFTKTGTLIQVPSREMVAPFGDDPRDQKHIKSGFEFYDENLD